MRLLAVPLAMLGLSGCLASYDNFEGLRVEPDMTVVGGGDMAMNDPCTSASGKSVHGTPYMVDSARAFVNGPLVRFEECVPGSKAGASAPTVGSDFLLTIPTSFLGSQTHHIVINGMYTSSKGPGTVLDSWVTPAITTDGLYPADVYHLLNTMGGLRAQMAKELKDAGRIPDGSESAFAAGFVFAYGSLSIRMEMPDEVKGTKFSIDGGTDAPTCDPKATCCVIYANSFDDFLDAKTPTILAQAATSSPTGFVAVVCPRPASAQTVTMTQTSTSLTDKLGSGVSPSKFAPFPVQLRPDGMTLIEYKVSP